MTDVSPKVYLDHWALRHFSEDQPAALRLQDALQRKGGTLAVSWANVAEFTKVESAATTRAAEEFLDRILPRIYFLEADAMVVAKREERGIAAGIRRPSPPHDADLDLLTIFISLHVQVASPQPMSFKGFFRRVYGKLSATLEELQKTTLETFDNYRREADRNPSFRRTLTSRTRPLPRQGRAAFMFRELAAGLLRDGRTKLTENDSTDLFHAVVPAAYCEFVLLDGPWRARVEEIRNRCEKARPPTRVARAFSKQDQGVERFLDALNAWSG